MQFLELGPSELDAWNGWILPAASAVLILPVPVFIDPLTSELTFELYGALGVDTGRHSETTFDEQHFYVVKGPPRR